MFLVEAATSFEGLDRRLLAGASIDVPRPGGCSNARALVIEGWAVGQDSSVSVIEILSNGVVVRRIRPSIERPDVVAFLNGREDVLRSGFRGVVDLVGLAGEHLEVRAVLSTDAIARIGSIHLRRFWQSGSHSAERGVASIVIVSFNQGHFLAEAIESALGQTHDRIEVIVVDDGSLDNTGEVAARYRGVRYVRQDNQGLAAARNTGIRRSNGEFLIFLDADDRLRPKAASIAVEHLAVHPECAFVSGEHCYIGVDGNVVTQWQRSPIVNEHYLALLQGNYVGCPAAAMFRRSVFQAVGGFDSRFNPCEDYDLYLRIARLFPVLAHNTLVAEYRRYGTAMSDDPARMLAAALGRLRHERRFVRGDRHRAAAIAVGRRYWREYYGRPLVALIQAQLQQRGSRLRALSGVLQLARHAPAQLATLALSRT